jgi:hypothetical protein
VIFYDSDWNPTVDQQAMDYYHGHSSLLVESTWSKYDTDNRSSLDFFFTFFNTFLMFLEMHVLNINGVSS